MGRRASWTGALLWGMSAWMHGQDTLSVVAEQADTMTAVTLAVEDSLHARDVLVDWEAQWAE